MRVSIAQINSTVGDFPGNSKKILAFARKARDEQKADIVFFQELALCGFPPLGLLDLDCFAELNARAILMLERELPPDIAVGLGYVSSNRGKPLVNAYRIILNGKLAFEQAKALLPSGGVFGEGGHCGPEQKRDVFEYKGERIGFASSGDFWQETDAAGVSRAENLIKELTGLGLSMLCVPSALPYMAGSHATRRNLALQAVRALNIPLAYINAVGANDEVILDGSSFVYTPAGGCVLSGKAFEEDLALWNSEGMAANSAEDSPHELDMLEEALVLGIRDYMKKCGFNRAHLGLSGGIDSALVVYLAARAAGAENITCFNMPSRFSSQGSKDDSRELAENLDCRYELLSIEPVFASALSVLEDVFQNQPFGIAEENLQARIRGMLWMAFSNKFNSMLLACGNKSEIAMGYCTLYGDTNGALAPIGDIFKTQVFALCRRINERSIAANGRAPIPQAIIDKPPSAELRPDQKDEDSLPPYEILDEILRLYLHGKLSPEEIVQKGWDRELVKRIVKTIARAEFKRRQLPPVLRVSPPAFGMGRKIPMARALCEIEELTF
jgi:NAD+ synthase (glutamine-hydrolysing)